MPCSLAHRFTPAHLPTRAAHFRYHSRSPAPRSGLVHPIVTANVANATWLSSNVGQKNMTADQVCQLIQARFGESVVISQFSPKSWLMDEKTKEPWRDYLLSMFRHRLVGADSRGVTKPVIDETKSFLREIERFTPQQTLYSFSASSASNVYAGWVIDDRIAFCIPNKK